MHAGLLHLGLNCAALFYIAPDTEAVYGCASALTGREPFREGLEHHTAAPLKCSWRYFASFTRPPALANEYLPMQRLNQSVFRSDTSQFPHSLELCMIKCIRSADSPSASEPKQRKRGCRYERFTAIFLLSGLSGSVASYMLSNLVTVGASGALFGLLGALAAYFVRNPRLERANQQLLYIFGILGVNIVLGLDEGGMIDNTGHIAGFVAGLWLGWWLSPRWKVCALILSLKLWRATLFESVCRDVDALRLSYKALARTACGSHVANVLQALPSEVPAATLALPTAPEAIPEPPLATSDPPSVAPPVEAQLGTSESATIQALSALIPNSTPPRTGFFQGSAPEIGDQKAAPIASEGSSGDAKLAPRPQLSLGADSAEVPRFVYRDVGSNTIRGAVVASFMLSLGVLVWAGTVERVGGGTL
jgi:hypothetical protein